MQLIAWTAVAVILSVGCNGQAVYERGQEEETVLSPQGLAVNANAPDDGGSEGGDETVLERCTHKSVCRLSVLSGIVLCVVLGVCLIVRGNRPQIKDDAATVSSTPSLLNGAEAYAVQDYLPHETLWPGPQEWKRMNFHSRGRVTAKVVKATTSVLRGPDAAERAGQLNEWVRSEEGIPNSNIEEVKTSLDRLLCQMDPSQELLTTDPGPPWPKQSRWRRISNRRKAMIFAEFMKGKITKRQHIRKYAKWVKERGYMLNRVDVANEEAGQTISKILSNVPVAFSDVADADPVQAACERDDEAVALWFEEEAAAGASEAAAPPHHPRPLPSQQLVPELSITVASPGDQSQTGRANIEDSFSVFAQYMRQSPNLEGLACTPPSSAASIVLPNDTDAEADRPSHSGLNDDVDSRGINEGGYCF